MIVSCAASVMTALPDESSWVAAISAPALAKKVLLNWIVSVAGVKFAMLTCPKFGAKTNVSCPADAKKFDEVLPMAWPVEFWDAGGS